MYIDPGTGSMLFTILVGTISAGAYALRDQMVKVRFYLSGGRSQKDTGKHPEYAIFSDSKRYWNVFEPICDEFESRGIELTYMTASEDDPALDKDYRFVKCEFIGEGNKAYAKLNMVSAYVVVSSTPGLGVYQWKRSKLVDYYIHVIHAANEIALYRMFGLDFYDAVLLSGQYQIDELRELEEKRYLPQKELVLAGIPYMDAMREKILTVAPRQHSGKCVLLAPSWGPNSIFNKYGSRVLDELIKTGYDIIVRPHPQSFIADPDMMQDIIEKYPETDKLRWDRSSDNFDSLLEADILISDFSGIIFDFTLAFDKPVVYANVNFNTDCYDHYWLDRKTLWTEDILPHLGLALNEENITDLKNVIDTCLSETRYKEGRDKARAETWAHMGEGAKRTADFIENKLKSFEAKKE